MAQKLRFIQEMEDEKFLPKQNTMREQAIVVLYRMCESIGMGRRFMRGTLIKRALLTPINGRFMIDDYWIWCGSVIKSEDGTYSMFASQ